MICELSNDKIYKSVRIPEKYEVLVSALRYIYLILFLNFMSIILYCKMFKQCELCVTMTE